MALAQEDINYIKAHLPEWLPKQVNSPVVYDLELRERVVRVEDELKHQRELMREGFERIDKRFQAVDKRFEAMDKRFEAMDKRFEKTQESMDKRFEAIDQRFQDMQKTIDQGFKQANQRFEEIQLTTKDDFISTHKALNRFIIWSITATLSVGGIVIAAMKYLP